MPNFFERFGIILNSGKTPMNDCNKFFLGLIKESTKLRGKIRCYLPKHIVLLKDSWKTFGDLQVLLFCDIWNPFGQLQ